MRTGVRLGLDWGEARIGVAACDAAGTIAFPVETVPAGDGAIERLRELVAAYDPVEIVVGLPRTLAGSEGPAAARIREHANVVAAEFGGLRLRLVDERLTTVAAARMLSDRGRSAKRQRRVIDQAAAVAILTGALDEERATGRPPGEVVVVSNEENR